jgi:tripartite-type tricarboxylate transporter receptor subunit TctC
MLLACAAVATLSAGTQAFSQAAFPDKPIALVVPFAAGGPTDAVARMIAIPMGKALGQTVLVENAAGAGGTIGAAKVARAAPNGYTILLHHLGMSTAPALYKKLAFDPLKDFEYIGQVVDVPMTLLARKDFRPPILPSCRLTSRPMATRCRWLTLGWALSHTCAACCS